MANVLGTQEAEICAVYLYDTQGKTTDTISSGDSLTISLEYNITKPMPDIAVIFGIYNEADIKCFETYILSACTTFGHIDQHGNFYLPFARITSASRHVLHQRRSLSS